MPLVDPTLSLAFAMHTSPGAYALLLGSGISRAAGIPTGWEVVTDLATKLAALMGEETGGDATSWYSAKFGEAPDYSKLLDALAKTPAERKQILRAYFEPTPEEREQELKRPTKAHKAIASLVARGYIRVILTTNFDRLLEDALEAEGVAPTVIPTPEAQDGALPLTHTQCTIIKLHGDYRDVRLRNTIGELSEYDGKTNQVLDRVLDEYGLIVCGWSGDWDIALRAAMERCPTRRFTTYWASRGRLSDAARSLAELRRAEVVEIADADTFFGQLDEKVVALEDISQPHPLSVKASVATLKRYLVEDRHRIALDDLIKGETETTYRTLTSQEFRTSLSGRPLLEVLSASEGATRTLQALMMVGAQWGQSQQAYLWKNALERIGNRFVGPRLQPYTTGRVLYPAMILMYVSGISAMASGNAASLFSLLVEAQVSAPQGQLPAAHALCTQLVLDGQEMNRVLRSNFTTPISEYLYSSLRPALQEIIPDDSEYEGAFDRFEQLVSLVAGESRSRGGSRFLAPIGRFAWKSAHDDLSGRSLLDDSLSQRLLDVGFFGGSRDQFTRSQASLDKFVQSLQLA